jgi:2-oxoglutarate dehydrogenase E2 component (dihydrolipoamide succinyltransferase)
MFISPVVAQMAAEHGLDLRLISGTGLGGRVSKKDVEHYLALLAGRSAAGASQPEAPRGMGEQALESGTPAGAATPAAQQTTPPLGSGTGAHTATDVASAPAARGTSDSAPVPDADLLPLTPMRRAIAEHMERSVRTAPHVTTVMECDMGRALAHRERHRAEFERQGARLTLTAYLVQAIVAGVRAAPILNSTWSEHGIVRHRRAHVGVAVALDAGLLVPVIRNADELSLLGIARALGDLAERARQRRLQPGETQGGTITLTNHGTTGSLLATPIINQPQSAILGVGAVQKRPVVLEHGGIDTIAIRPMCYLSLTFDHRVTDGAVADTFLAAVKGSLETGGM